MKLKDPEEFVISLLIMIATPCVALLCGYGWVENIIKLAHSGGPVNGEMLLRVVGVFVAPLGIVMGYL